MTELEFLRPPASADLPVRALSPVARALAKADPTLGIEDISLSTAKLEVRGELGDFDLHEVVRIAPTRALVLCPIEEEADVYTRLREQGSFVVDLWAALAGLRVRGEKPMQRLTDLDLERLPAVGRVAGVRAVVLRDGDEFRIFFAQEYGDYVTEVVVDAAEGLR